MKKYCLLVCLLPGFMLLGGCPEQSAENAETEQRIAVCQEIMQLYIKEANTYERDRKRTIGSCQISQRERTLEQWRCALDTMKKGAKYIDAANQCSGGNPAAK